MSKAKDQITTVGKRYTVKLWNRRVSGIMMKDGTISFRFKRLGDGRPIHYERIHLTPEALNAMGNIAQKVIQDKIDRVINDR